MNITTNNIKIIRKNIKHTYIRVKAGNIIVTTNYLTPKIYINSLIKNNIKSIEKMLEQDLKKQEKDQNFYLFGKKYNLIYNNNLDNIVIQKDEITTKNQEQLKKYINKLVELKFSEQLEFWFNKFEENIPKPNLKIRKMKTRWGVCNTKNNNVTLNYYLYKYSPECLDYVIVHELSHFIEGNHSKNFWKIVEKYYPNYKEIRKKLKN